MSSEQMSTGGSVSPFSLDSGDEDCTEDFPVESLEARASPGDLPFLSSCHVALMSVCPLTCSVSLEGARLHVVPRSHPRSYAQVAPVPRTARPSGSRSSSQLFHTDLRNCPRELPPLSQLSHQSLAPLSPRWPFPPKGLIPQSVTHSTGRP